MKRLGVSVDTSLVAGALTTPWWLTMVQDWLGLALVAAGLVLATLRICLAWRDLHNKRKDKTNG